MMETEIHSVCENECLYSHNRFTATSTFISANVSVITKHGKYIYISV